MPYYAKKRLSDEVYVDRVLSLTAPQTDEGYSWEEISDPNDVEIYVEPVLVYNPDTLITWAMAQEFNITIMSHMAAFLDFANKGTVASKNNFLTYAYGVGLVEVANEIIAKATELGAELGGE